MTTGLSLRTLIKHAQEGGQDILCDGQDFKLEPKESESRIQTVVTSVGSEKKEEQVYVEFKPYELSGRRRTDERVVKRVCDLGNLLRVPKAWDAGFHTLQLQYIIQQRQPPRFVFVFQLPRDKAEPVTLLQTFQSKQFIRPTLGQKFRIAKELTETLFQFHSVGWLHKSVRSENILFFREDDSHVSYASQYLVGFEFSRDENDRSTTERDDKLERNIYRHPDRQGPPEERFNIIHDIYALGVVLLEIGLWKSAIGFENFSDLNADKIKDRLEEHARFRLPHYMGTTYTNLVLACLEGSFGNYDINGPQDVEHRRERLPLQYYETIIGGIENGVQLE